MIRSVSLVHPRVGNARGCSASCGRYGVGNVCERSALLAAGRKKLFSQDGRDGVTVDKLEKLPCKKLEEYLDFSNRFCALSVQKHGAIDSYPTWPRWASDPLASCARSGLCRRNGRFLLSAL